MPSNFVHLNSLEQLESLIASSHEGPVVIFKHSNTCGISAGVIREVEAVEAAINIVTIQRNRDISNAITLRTGVRHESPQAIVLSKGEPIYYASHYDITQRDIEASLAVSAASAAGL